MWLPMNSCCHGTAICHDVQLEVTLCHSLRCVELTSRQTKHVFRAPAKKVAPNKFVNREDFRRQLLMSTSTVEVFISVVAGRQTLLLYTHIAC